MENGRKIIFIMVFITCCVLVRMQKPIKIPKTSFSCEGRPAGYYADIDTGCQFYHMCDGLGRKFSYSCPNTTLFQQRMFICDHWYMVNCSTSERDYKANLLIGQKDKPFVDDNEEHQRTPRPDILSIPYAQAFNYYNDISREQNPSGSERNAVTIDNEIVNEKSDRVSNTAPNRWSTELTGNGFTTPSPVVKKEISGFSGRPIVVTGPSGPDATTPSPDAIAPELRDVLVPSKFFEPPIFSSNERRPNDAAGTTVRSIASFNDQLLSGSTKSLLDATGSQEESFQVSSTEKIESGRSFDSDVEIQTSSETAGFVPIDNRIPSATPKNSRKETFVSVTEKVFENESIDGINSIADDDRPALDLLPPKFEYAEIASTTMGPPIYYEWKWATFDLEPPKRDDEADKKDNSDNDANKTKEGRPEFALPRTTTQKSIDSIVTEANNTFDLSSYFIPNYTFPLDKQHPGYEEDGAMTSFQVRIPTDKERSDHPYYGENPECPQCHPSFVVPGTCKPCIMIRR